MPTFSRNEIAGQLLALGVTADLFWRQTGVVRSDHLQAFAAVGPHAEATVKTLLPLPCHVRDSPVGLVHDLDGHVLQRGVGHEADTSLHLAELIAKVPYGIPRHCMVMQQRRRVRVDYVGNDHCCQRFALADSWLRARGLQAEGPVGHGMARLARASDIVGLAVDAMRRQPTIFLHGPEEGCAECDAARCGA